MICRHCTQWNADAATRCCFCDNALDSEVDQTRTGRVTTHHNVKVLNVPPSTAGSALESLLGVAPGRPKLPDLIVQLVLVALFVLAMIVYATCHC